VPGEAILIAAAVFAGSGHLNIALVILVAVLGAIIGENIVDIYAAFDHYKWYVIAALAVAVGILITRRVMRRRVRAIA